MVNIHVGDPGVEDVPGDYFCEGDSSWNRAGILNRLGARIGEFCLVYNAQWCDRLVVVCVQSINHYLWFLWHRGIVITNTFLLFSPYVFPTFSFSFTATVVRINHECIQYTAKSGVASHSGAHRQYLLLGALPGLSQIIVWQSPSPTCSRCPCNYGGRSSVFTGSKDRACDRESREDHGKRKGRDHTGTHRDE